MTLETRDTIDSVNVSLKRYRLTSPVGTLSESQTDQYITTGGSVTRDMIPGRNWKAIIRSGGNATTYQLGTRYICDYSPGAVFCTDEQFSYVDIFEGGNYVTSLRGDLISSSYGYEFGGVFLSPGYYTVDADYVSADNQAKANFYKAARAAQTLEQGGVFAIEIKEAIHGIRHPAEAIQQFLRNHLKRLSKRSKVLKHAIRHRDMRTVHNLTGSRVFTSEESLLRKMVSKSWLEAQFHWLPLVSDVVSSAEALASLSTRSRFKRVVGYGKDVVVLPRRDLSVSFTHVSATASFKDEPMSFAEVKYYGSIRTSCSESDGFSPSFIESFGFNASNFIPTLYNVIPFTFVLDYFSNLGDMIDALSFLNSSIAWVTIGSVVEASSKTCDFDVQFPPETLVNTYNGSFYPGFSKVGYRQVFRDSVDPDLLDIGSFQFKIPGISSRKWLNLGALASELANFRL